MRNTIRTAIVAALWAAALGVSATSLADGAEDSPRVKKARFGSLRREDMVVVDVTGVPDGSGGTGGVDTNAVRGIVREELGDLSPDDIGALPDTYVPPVTFVNGKTGTVELVAGDVHALPDTYVPPVTSVNGKTGDVVVAVSDVAGAMTTNAVEFIVGRHYETNTSVRIGALETRVGATESRMDGFDDWKASSAVTWEAVESGFTEWYVSFADPPASGLSGSSVSALSVSGPPREAVVAPVMAGDTFLGWSLFSPTDTVHAAQLADLKPVSQSSVRLEWAASETIWSSVVTAVRTRVPTVKELDAKALDSDLRSSTTALSDCIDGVDARLNETKSGLASVAAAKADRNITEYELDPPHMDTNDVWVVDLDGAVLGCVAHDPVSGGTTWQGVASNNTSWAVASDPTNIPAVVRYTVVAVEGPGGVNLSSVSVHDDGNRPCGFRTTQADTGVVVVPGTKEEDLRYDYEDGAVPDKSWIVLSYLPLGGTAWTNVVRIGRGRRRRVESHVVYSAELDQTAAGLRDELVSRKAVETGFTEWAIKSDRPLGEDVVPGMVDGFIRLWSLFPAGSTDRSSASKLTTVTKYAPEDVTNLTWAASETSWRVAVTATRTRVPSMKDLQSIESTASSRWETVSTYIPWLEDYATNNYTAAKLANRRAKQLEAWQYTNSVSRSGIASGYTEWAVTPMWPLGRVVVDMVSDRIRLWNLFRPGAADHSHDKALLGSIVGGSDATNLVWHNVSWPVKARWTNELDRAGIAWSPDADSSTNVVARFDVRATRMRIPSMKDLETIESTASSRWETVSTYIPWLEDYATNNYTAAKLANRRAKQLEAWQYTNSVSRSDMERGITDWAVTPMWPLGRVVVRRIDGGANDGKWTLFRPGESKPMSLTNLEPRDAGDEPMSLEWEDVQIDVDARWTNGLKKAGIVYGNLREVEAGKTNVTAHMDVKASRVRVTPGNYAVVSNAAMNAAQSAALDPLLFAQYYPEGNVKSAAEFTDGIKYDDPDTVNRTITVKMFTNSGDGPPHDNSGLVGRVVIPPFVDAVGSGYISDDGKRYRVVGVSNGRGGDETTNLVDIVAPNTVTTIGFGSFVGCSGLTSISLPSATTIGEAAFSFCDALTSASLPSATTIGNEAFYDCGALTSVSLPAATSVESSAFSDCTALTSVSLPSATTIGDGVFSTCTSLTSVSLPSATTIGNEAFYDCGALAVVDFGDIPRSSVPSLGSDAFYNVPASCKIVVPDAQYDAWTAATLSGGSPNPWYALVTQRYRFLRHSEWEYARRYELSAISAPTNRHALFVIDLNPGESRKWSGIELKATTNNFAVTESGEGMLFYCPTVINGVEGEQGTYRVGTNDWCRLFVLSRRADSDIRRWMAISNTADLANYAPLSLAVLVSQDKLRRVADKDWLYEGNKELIWSFVRTSFGDSTEKDQDGRQCWRPIMPVKWYDKLPDWANKSPGVFDSAGIKTYVAPWLEAVSEADTSYRRFVGITNVNQSVQYVETDETVTEIEILPPANGETKDWVVYIYAGTNVTLKLPSGVTWWTSDAANTNAIKAARPTALYFSQVSDNIFMFGRQELKSLGVIQ